MQVKVASEKRKEQSLLELEIDSQLEFIKYSRTQGCSDKVTIETWEDTQVFEGNSWITYFALISDKSKSPLGKESKGIKVINAVLENNYLMT